MTWRVFSGSRVTAVLCLLLLAINLIAGWAVVSAVREAEEAAHRDLQSRAAADAHSLMAVLAATRADLQFLSQSPALAELRAVLGDRDPMVRRWRRLDIESTLLLFLDSQPEVEELRILGPDGGGVIAAGRRGGAPVLTASEVEMQPGHRPHADDLIGSFPLPGSPPAGILEAVVHVDTLLAGALPAAGARLIRNPQLHNARQVLEAVVVPVHDPGWDPEVKWALAFPENRGFFDSLGKLGTRYRSTLAANLLLILLVGFFGIVSIRQARARALLEAEYRRQQEIGALERQVLHNERLAGIGRLAAGLAHEINNPLEGMSNYLALLESDLQAGRPEQCLQWARQVRQGLNRTAGITRQVLQFAEPGDAPPVVLDLRRVLEETVDFVRSNRQFRTARIELALPPAQLLVHGNAVTLSQVFLNLLLNAVEMQACSGHTTITGSAQDGQVNVVVEDDGPGIPDETLSRIFEPFFSGRGSTGLGLFICEGIVRQHGGSIQAFNRPAGGAVFTVSLPMASTGIAGAEESRGASKAS
jgi:signal transduction histidine kinase